MVLNDVTATLTGDVSRAFELLAISDVFWTLVTGIVVVVLMCFFVKLLVQWTRYLAVEYHVEEVYSALEVALLKRKAKRESVDLPKELLEMRALVFSKPTRKELRKSIYEDLLKGKDKDAAQKG